MNSAEPFRILVTNDDGTASPGLWHLAASLVGPGREIVVAAPQRDSSGFAAAVGDVAHGAAIEASPVEWPPEWPANDTPAWAVDGPPGRCVLGGVLGIFGPRPHLVVSGINAGANVGRFLQLHSGTLGAALTAANSGTRAMAVSLDTPHGPDAAEQPMHWQTAAQVAAALVDQLRARPRGTVWNVNVPNIERALVRGIAEGRPGRSRQALEARSAGEGRHELHLVPLATTIGDAPTSDERSDRDLLDAGMVSVTSVTAPGLLAVGEIELDFA
jgi:5'-nucleotidase